MHNLHAPTEVTSMACLKSKTNGVQMPKQIPDSSLSKITGVSLENTWCFSVNKDCTLEGNHLIPSCCALFRMKMEAQRV